MGRKKTVKEWETTQETLVFDSVDGAPLTIAGRQVDGRRSEAKRFAHLCREMGGDLSGGQRLSIAQTQLIRRAAALSVQAEMWEARLASGESVNVDEFTKLINTLTRVFAQLGLHRRAIDVTPGRGGDFHAAAILEHEEF